MNFSIEVSGESNPLTPAILQAVVARAASSNPQLVQTGTQQLQNWERHPGFYSSLQVLYAENSLPLEVRFLSLNYLKNGIDKHWRKTTANTLSKEEKALIRNKALQLGLDEPDKRLALQNAIIIAKISRFEFPQEWPDVLTLVIEQLRRSMTVPEERIRLPRILLVLLYIIKELSTAKLQRSRVSLVKASPEIFMALKDAYSSLVSHWTSNPDGPLAHGPPGIQVMEDSLLTLRIMRRLLIAGYEHPNRHNEVEAFWIEIRQHFGGMFPIVLGAGHGLRNQALELMEKHLVQMSKLHLQMAKVHPAAFPLLPDSISVARDYWTIITEFGKTFGSSSATVPAKIGTDGDAEDDVPYLEKLSLKGLLLLRACVKMVYNPAHTFKYQRPEDKVERKTSMDAMKEQMLAPSTVKEMMETLVTRFFVFRERDLREWEEVPSEWEKTQEGEGEDWEFSIRICAEKLFLDLLTNNKQLLEEPLLKIISVAASKSNEDILQKDSVYAAIGLAAPVLEKKFNFETYLRETLVTEIQLEKPGASILRRRIAILLGQWVPVVDPDRTLVYQIFSYLLDKAHPLNDLVVRVTAGRQLKTVIETCVEFRTEPFVPFAANILGRMMALIEEVELVETRIALLLSVQSVVTQLEHHVVLFADQIISSLPPLWEQAGEEWLMKQMILSLLAALTGAMKSDSARLHALILPVVHETLQEDSPSRLYLKEDAFELWAAIVEESPQPTQELLQLTVNLVESYDAGSDTFRRALEITESYILLAPQFMLEHSSAFLPPLAKVLSGGMKREAVGVDLAVIDLFLQAAYAHGGVDAITELTKVMVETNVLGVILGGIKEAYEAGRTTGPHKKTTEIYGLVETDHFTLLARIMFASPQLFEEALSATTVAGSLDSNTREWVLKQLFSHFEDIGSPDKKKLVCLAITNLLDLAPQEWVMNSLQDMIIIWTDVITECCEGYEEDGPGGGKDTLVYHDPDGLKGPDPESPESERRRNMTFSDPVHRLDIKVVVREKLQRAIEVCGGNEAFQRDWLVNVDADVIKSFGTLGVL